VSSFLTAHQHILGYNVVWVGRKKSQSSEHVSTRNDFSTGVSKHGTHLEQTLLKRICSCKIFRTLPYDIPTSLAVSVNFIDCPSTSVSMAQQQSSVVASIGRPALRSSSNDVLPRLNPATHLVTVAYDGALFLFSTATGSICLNKTRTVS